MTTYQPQRIAVGVDGSIASHHAVCWTIDHARPGDVITLVHAAQRAPITTGTAQSSDDAGRAFLRHELARFACVPRDPSITLTSTLLHGDPGESLCNLEADLLVIGAGSHSRLTGALLGSISAHLAHHTPTPLVIVPAQRSRS